MIKKEQILEVLETNTEWLSDNDVILKSDFNKVADEIVKLCNLHIVMRSTLEQKEESYKEICAWFENEYSPAITDEDEVNEWNKKAIEVNAQIKLLRFLLSEYCV